MMDIKTVYNLRRLPTGSPVAIILIFLCALASACTQPTTSNGLSEDITAPVVSIEDINPGDTLSINFSYTGTFLELKFMDETGLSAYDVDISRGDTSVLNVNNEAFGTLSNYSLDISSLNTNTLYDVQATVRDKAGNSDSLVFTMEIFFQEAIVDYEEIYVVGTATSGGYDLALQSAMTVNPNNPNIFTWSDTLSVGEFKLKTYPEEDFCAGDWIHPAEEDQSLGASAFTIEVGCAEDNPDYKWNVEVPGIYSITLNFLEETITINQDQIIGETFDEIYMVGSASPGGWDLASQTSLDQNPQNEFEFNWTGELVAGEFKFKVYADNDFCGGRWIHPLSQGQDLTDNTFELLVGCDENNPDYKWVIGDTEEGNYSIQINMASRTINISEE